MSSPRPDARTLNSSPISASETSCCTPARLVYRCCDADADGDGDGDGDAGCGVACGALLCAPSITSGSPELIRNRACDVYPMTSRPQARAASAMAVQSTCVVMSCSPAGTSGGLDRKRG